MRSRLILACLGTLLVGSAAMAADLAVDVETTIDYNGTFQDFTIPSVSTPSELQLFLKGGDGGKRVVPGLCTAKGGRGAKVFARFPVGTGAGELRPGGRIRFIVGKDGDSNRSNNVVGAGGGGGTAVLYTSSPSPGCGFPSTSLSAQSFSWVILAVAGGGGGAYTSGVCGGEDGDGGQATEHGTSGTGDDSFRGEDGNGGQNGGSNEDCNSGGPGGGAFTGGLIVGCDGNSLLRAGAAGLCTGGSGGIASNAPDGGFGYGGGGSGSNGLPNTGGGAGGGYSGGGGGEFFGRGGGGGSFLSAGSLNGSYKENGGETKTPDPGYATYVLGALTSVTAVCRDVRLDLGAAGTAQLFPPDVDGGSIIPDSPDFTVTRELRINKGFPAFFSAGSSLDYDCGDVGDGSVTLWALQKDGNTLVNLDACIAPISVRDPRDFTLSGLPDITATAAPGTCQASLSGLGVPTPQGLCAETGVTLSYLLDLKPAGQLATTIPYQEGELRSLDVAAGAVTVSYAGESSGGGTSPATTYDITVLSGRSPIARCHDVSIQLDASGQASIAPSLVDGMGDLLPQLSGDPCKTPVALSLDRSSFTCADVGPQTVTLTVTGNSGLASTCTATVTVGADSVDPTAPGCAEAVNDPPTISAPAGIAVSEDVPKALTAISFDDPDADPDYARVTLTLVDGGRLSVILGGGGGVNIGISPDGLSLVLFGYLTALNDFFADGRVLFTPAADHTGDVTLAVLIDDQGFSGAGGAKTASQDVTLAIEPVNDPPVISAPASIAVTEDTSTAVTGISFADPDADPDPVSVTLTVGDGELAASSGGGVTIGGNATGLTLDGTVAAINGFLAASGVTFTPAADADEDVTLVVSIDDQGNNGSGGAETSSQDVTLDLDPVNDPPVVTAPASLGVTEDLASPLVGLVFADPDAGSDAVLVTLSVPSGSLAAAPAAGIVASGSAGDLALEGSLTAINGLVAGGGLTFTTALNDTSIVALAITVDDQGHSGSGGSQTDTASVDLLVTSVNDPPTIDAPTTLSLSVGSAHPLWDLAFDDPEAGDLDVLVTLTVDGGELAYAGPPEPASAPRRSTAVGAPDGDSVARLIAGGTPTALTLLGSVDDLNAAFSAGEMTFIADGPGTFTLTVTIDDQGAGAGPPEQTSATVLLNAVVQQIATEVPTLGSWGLLALLVFLAGAALHQLRR